MALTDYDFDYIFSEHQLQSISKDLTEEDEEEMNYHMASIDLSDIPLKHIERYVREKKLENLKKSE